MNKHHTTISNEIKRGQVKFKTKVKYSAQKGQEVYESNRERSKRPIKLTAELNKRISQGTKAKYSLKVIHQELETAVCLRTLYNWLYMGVAYHDLLYPQYRSKQGKKRGTSPKRPLGLSIEDRPPPHQ